MSFKDWFINMSTLEMISLLISFAITLSFAIAIFFSFKGSSRQFKAASIFLNRDKWRGDFYHSTIESWQQTNMCCGNNYFYDIYFYLNSDTVLYHAKALIAPGQMHLLRKGLPVIVKKGRGNKIAIIQIGQ